MSVPILTDEQRADFRKEFERMGVRGVKAELKAQTYSTFATKRIAAEEFVEEHEESLVLAAASKRDARERKTLYISLAAIIISTISAAINAIANGAALKSFGGWVISCLH